jgi:hypothetical protein
MFEKVPPDVIAVPQESYAVWGGLTKITNLSEHGRKVSYRRDEIEAYMKRNEQGIKACHARNYRQRYGAKMRGKGRKRRARI